MTAEEKRYFKEYNEKNKPAISSKRKTFYLKNKERLNAESKKYHLIHGERYRQNRIFKKYGVRKEVLDFILIAQNFSCAICKTTKYQRNMSDRLVIDHDHKTGKVRGLLCDLCNRAIGLLKDSPTILEEAAVYLRSRGHE